MVLSGLLAAVAIFLDSPILMVGAMVVGPEFGPIAGICVALVHPPRSLGAKSLAALAVGFPLAILAVALTSVIFRATGVTGQEFGLEEHTLAQFIASPDFLTFFVAVCAGAAGMLSLSTAKSGALMGVLISVTTIPAAANVGIAAAYGDWGASQGSLAQLAVNLAGIVLADQRRWPCNERCSSAAAGVTSASWTCRTARPVDPCPRGGEMRRSRATPHCAT